MAHAHSVGCHAAGVDMPRRRELVSRPLVVEAMDQVAYRRGHTDPALSTLEQSLTVIPSTPINTILNNRLEIIVSAP